MKAILRLAVIVILFVTAFGAVRHNSDVPGRLSGVDMISADRDHLKDGGILRVAQQSYPRNFNFHQIDALAVSQIQETTTPYFFTFNERGNPVLNTDYATSIRVTKQNPFTVTYEINPEAVWSDGTPIQFSDFYGDWRANNGRNAAYRIASSEGFQDITSVRQGSSNKEVSVTFDAPYAAWREVFNGLLPAALTKTANAFNTSWRARPLLSGGPFMVSEANASDQVVTEIRNPRWWGQRPRLAGLAIRTLDGDAIARAYANGELDAIAVESDANNLAETKYTPHTKILRAAGTTRYTLDMNGSSPQLRDVNVRRAILRGVDRKEIARSRLSSLGVPAAVLNNHIYAPGQSGYADTASDIIGYNPVAAGKLLDNAGWKLAGNVRRKGGKPLSLRMVVIANSANFVQPALQVQDSLRRIGVKVTIREYSVDTYFDDYITPGNFDLAYFYWTAIGPYPECEYSPYYPADSLLNDTRVSTDRIGRLFRRACATDDASLRRRLTNEADRLVFRLAAAAPVYVQPNIGAVRDTLANYDEDSSTFQIPDWTNVGFLK